ncbi:hypothetical protein K151_1424 [Proteus hauseri ZMd44]|nr:hypothetical protein K151_1424 [Proteus hauseri ZMd44]
MVFADEKCIFKLLPLGVDAGAQSENVKANSFWFLAITVFAVVPASVTVIGSNKIEKSALFPPLIVQVVSLIAPEKEIIPPALLVAANADVDNIATDNNDSGSLFLSIYNPKNRQIFN